jgi:hypothetical protein
VIVDGAPAESGESGLSITGLVGVKSNVLMAALGEGDGDTHAEAGDGVGGASRCRIRGLSWRRDRGGRVIPASTFSTTPGGQQD